jgi:alpha-D-xyloside xylohydrolase
MRVAHESGLPPMRPLFVDHPDDPASWQVEDQYLFGPDVLVAPVYTEGARERRVWLPPGATWVNAWSKTEHQGGQWVDAPAPLDTIPVYLRQGGAVAPFGPLTGIESAGE